MATNYQSLVLVLGNQPIKKKWLTSLEAPLILAIVTSTLLFSTETRRLLEMLWRQSSLKESTNVRTFSLYQRFSPLLQQILLRLSNNPFKTFKSSNLISFTFIGLSLHPKMTTGLGITSLFTFNGLSSNKSMLLVSLNLLEFRTTMFKA